VDPAQAERYLESLDVLGERYGLERIRELLARLDSPEARAPAIHVVGSNGKTSTARFAAAALRAADRRVGLYTSPHVTGWHERIEIDGRPVTPETFAGALQIVRSVAEGLDEPATQFEVLTACAFLLFAQGGVDAMVIEAGLGGRHDATNVLEGAVVALTRVDLEHTRLLGDTVTKIAAEKLAVAKRSSMCLVSGPLSPEAEAATSAHAEALKLRRRRYPDDFDWSENAAGLTVTTKRANYTGLAPAARGLFQRENLALALAAAEELFLAPLPLEALRRALRTLSVPGRFEITSTQPTVIADGAHNPAGAAALVTALEQEFGDSRIVLVFGALRSKDLDGMARSLAGVVDRAIATTWPHPDARPAGDVAAALWAAGVRVDVQPSHELALRTARGVAGSDAIVVVTGSLYLIEAYRRCELLGVR